MKYFISGDIHGFYDEYCDKPNFESFIPQTHNISSHLHDIHNLSKLVQKYSLFLPRPRTPAESAIYLVRYMCFRNLCQYIYLQPSLIF